MKDLDVLGGLPFQFQTFCWHSLRVCQEQGMTAKWAFHTLNVAVEIQPLFKSLGELMMERP